MHFRIKAAFTTWFTNDAAGRRIAERNPNGETVQFAYAASGDLTNLTDAATHTTAWQYDAYGLVTNKTDALGATMFTYRYDANGRLTNRWTPEKSNTGYAYDALGNLTNVAYATSHSISVVYDLLSRLTKMVDAVGTTVYQYTSAGLLASEDGPWADDAVSFAYTNRQRTGLSLQQPQGQAAWSQTYAYDAAQRLTNITSAAGAFGYAFDVGRASLPAWLTLPGGLLITNQYDPLARLLSTQLKSSGGAVLDAHSYVYASQTDRISGATRTAGNTVSYAYDDAGQLTRASGAESGGTNRVLEQFGYAYDAAGNPRYRTNNDALTEFPVNSLNQPDHVLLSGTGGQNKLTVAGLVSTAATNVTVNTSNAALYSDNAFARDGLSWVEGANTYTAVAKDALGRTSTNQASVTLHANIYCFYDLNGNLRTNGTLVLGYDDENQLVWLAQSNAWKTDFTYDGKMRRRERWESVWDGAKWVTNLLVRYVYDGLLVLQERHYNPQLSTTYPQLLVTYTRGRDLSGSLQGAGGIGGLLARSESGPLAIGNQLSMVVYHADNVGNITCLATTNGQIAARYLYEPFGTIIAMGGPLAERNLYRFSSKEWHENSALVYYGFRCYSPSLQRWLNRDPIEEAGGINLYGFVRNSPLGSVDSFGSYGNPVCGPDGPIQCIYPWNPPPPRPLLPRNCDAEFAACIARGMVVCGLFEGGMNALCKIKSPWPYRVCFFAYGVVCAQQRKACQNWNLHHGFAN